ncbi:MAG: undecaprenyl-diphosphate phosphatase [Planctomycetaceae bacterium]|nr:undecaprenyl-diphosphate phosphatase [Planctomycetaceae bacterium]
MSIVDAIILGIVQGIAEFLPVSSSGHLVIANHLLADGNAVPDESPTMTVALHFGTLLSIAVVYWRDLWELRREFRTMAMIVIATIPVGVTGLVFKDRIEELMTLPLPVGFALIATAAVLFVSQRLQKETASISQLSWWSAWFIGLFQAVAILPGISRSGSTIAGGLFCGLKRNESTRFSFLIAIPAIGGATVVKARDLLGGETAFNSAEVLPLLTGTLVSFFVGLLALRFLIRIVSANRLHWFAAYCLIVGTGTVIWQLTLHD